MSIPDYVHISISEAECVIKFKELSNRADAVGLTILCNKHDFRLSNISSQQGDNGGLVFSDLASLEDFLTPYELGYRSGL